MSLDNIILQMVMMLVPTIAGSAIGSITTYYRTAKKMTDSMRDSNKLLIKMALRDMHRSVCIEERGCTMDDKDDATQLYSLYKALGGNGTGKSMYDDIMRAKVTK